MGPVVSAIMPVSGKHSNALVHRARKLFSVQTYPHKQLVELRLDDVPLGELRNICIRQSMGSIVAHWDSDDWYHPRRLEIQVEALRSAEITGAEKAYFLDDAANKAWRWEWQDYEHPYLLGSSLCYRRAVWDYRQFDPYRSIGEDSAWQATLSGVIRAKSIPLGYLVANRHAGNTSEQNFQGCQWTEADPAVVRKCMEVTEWA